MKVLIIDDSKTVFTFVSNMLNLKGHESVWAEDGEKGKEYLKKDHYDLILLDWNMPNLSGLEFLKKNMTESFVNCPIIMMTTEDDPRKIKEALDLGVSEYLMKPFTDDILMSKIESLKE